jgi:RNA polymerase sigma factor (TIGR02999 family)
MAATMMRRVLVDHGRRQKARKRGGTAVRVTLEDNVMGSDGADGLDELDLMALDRALDELAALDAQQAKIVELRAFGGLTVEETAEILGVSPATIKRHWTFALAWLNRRLADPGEPAG